MLGVVVILHLQSIPSSILITMASLSSAELAPQSLRDDFALWSYTAPMGYGLDAPMLVLPDELFGFTLADLVDQFVAQRIVPVSAAHKMLLLAEGRRLVRLVNKRRRREYLESKRCGAQSRFFHPSLTDLAAGEFGPYTGVPYPLIWLQVCQDGFRSTPGYRDDKPDLIDAIYHVHHDGLLAKFQGWEVEQYRRYKLNPSQSPSLLGYFRNAVDDSDDRIVLHNCRLPVGTCHVHATPSSHPSSRPAYLQAAAALQLDNAEDDADDAEDEAGDDAKVDAQEGAEGDTEEDSDMVSC